MDSEEIIEIYLSSSNADSLGTEFTNDVTFHIPNIEILKDEKAYVSVKNCVFPCSWYNVNETNNILNYQVNNLPYT